MSTLFLSRDSPTNSKLTDLDGSTVYVVKTKHKWKDEVTGISRADGEELVSVTWKPFSDEMFTMNCKTAPLADLLQRDNKLGSSNRFFNNAAGQRFQWKILNGHLYCVDETTGLSVAAYYRSGGGIFSKGKSAYIDISEQVTDEQDLFVVTCLMMENINRYRKAIMYSGGGWYLAIKSP
ncbi:unnamed protein product [Rhizoctonia solani]|uniref:DUF6593 domain-containing protein n=1 Tax=Rhizoctonia solani TaxID=456999 RepID=A0A8H2XQ54_9AGAM|nr:unnamed protein product [Rhizoctonia solani]CAE6451574.1 unnamed protein product [Rhizoctonia solani]